MAGHPVQLMIPDPSPAAGLPMEAPEVEAAAVRCYFCEGCGVIHQENEAEFGAHRRHADSRGVWRKGCLAVNPAKEQEAVSSCARTRGFGY